VSEASFRRLAIVDSKGRERIVLGSHPLVPDQPQIDLLDQRGKTRLILDVNPHGDPELLLCGPDGLPRVLVTADEKGGTSLVMGLPAYGLVVLQTEGAEDKWTGQLSVKNTDGRTLLESAPSPK
jgi:hypothetical protein